MDHDGTMCHVFSIVVASDGEWMFESGDVFFTLPTCQTRGAARNLFRVLGDELKGGE